MRAMTLFVRRTGFVAALWALALPALATVVPNSITVSPDIGRGQNVNVSIPWSRTVAGAAESITVTIPSNVTVDPPAPPAGCSYVAPIMTCTVPAGGTGATGTITFPIQGAVLGGFNLTAVGTGGSASVSSTVHNTGDITVAKSKTSPAGNAVGGSPVVFQLAPNIASGGDDVPAGASVVVADNLPGTMADFNLTGVTFSGPLTPTCNAVASANANGTRKLTCTYAGAFTTAQLNASKITVTGTQGNSGDFTNTASVASGSTSYYDSNTTNNISNVAYHADPGIDVQAQGAFPAAAQAVNTPQTLTITYKNNGPTSSPAGGTVQAVVPSTFALGTLPAGCTAAPGGSLTVSGTTYAGTVVTCTTPTALANGASTQFAIPLTMPVAPEAGNFPVLVTPPPGYGDGNTGNNAVLLPYQITQPFADLSAFKGKSPGGPQVAGTDVTTTLTIKNEIGSTNDAVYDPAHPLRIVDWARPEEVAGGVVAGVTAGWSCTATAGASPPSGVDAANTTRVECHTTGSGTLVRNSTTAVSFTSKIGVVAEPVALRDTTCTGGTVLSQLSLPAGDGPQPADAYPANDCTSYNGDLVATPVVGGEAAVRIVKESSVDGTDWRDAVADAPTLAADASTLYWRITITTPSTAVNPNQKPIPTLNLSDSLPGILNVTHAGAPSYKTPAITVSTDKSGAGGTTGSCPNIATGNNGLTCSFGNVPQGATIVVTIPVQRSLDSGTLTNTATLTSPNAILTKWGGAPTDPVQDSAAVIVVPRTDLRLNTKTFTSASGTLKVGEPVQFNITAQNLGENAVTAGNFTITDALFTGTPDQTTPAYDVLSVTPSGPAAMDCSASNLAAGTISCVNTGVVNRYDVQTLVVVARPKKPSGLSVAAGGLVYSQAENTAHVTLGNGMCEYRIETTTQPAQQSATCDDAASTSNNSLTAKFDIYAPAIDLQQGKKAVYPNGQDRFLVGDDLRYRFSIRNAGPSRAEDVTMTDVLVVPSGFHLALSGAPQNINGAPASTGYGLAVLGSRAVTCSQAGQDANVVCKLAPAGGPASYLDAGEEVNFELVLAVNGTATGPVTFGDRAHVCADETNTYETSGKCVDDPATAGNNIVAVNDTMFPAADLAVLSKTTITPSPVDVGQPIEYRIVLSNVAGTTVQKMRLVDTLPDGFDWLNTAGHAPIAAAAAGASLNAQPTVSASVPANGTDNVCFVSNGVASVTAAGQHQEVTCDFGGSFPVGGTVTLTLWARAVPGVYAGPFNSDRGNTAEVHPGKGTDGGDVSIDKNSANNIQNAQVQVHAASLSGRVFADANGNGDTDAGDAGIPNVTVTLTGTDINGNTVTFTTTTDSNGDYSFTNLPPSNSAGYTLTETQPSGYISGTAQPNTTRPVRNGTSTGTTPAGGSYTLGDTPSQSVIAGIVLASSANAVQFDFPETHERSLSGYVYADGNGNNVRDAGSDPAIAGATVELLDAGTGTVIATTTTDANGQYTFNGLSSAKTYTLREPLPAGYANLSTAVNPGLVNGAACVGCVRQTGVSGDAATTDRIAGIDLSAGNGTLFNFGEAVVTAISGTVYLDRNDDGDMNAGDAGIPGVTVTIVGAGPDGVFGTADDTSVTLTTDADGHYVYPDAKAGQNYRIVETQPPGLADGKEHPTNTITITGLPLAGATGNDFGELASTLSGRVYLDANNNGHYDAGDQPIAGVKVSLPAGTLDVFGKPVTEATTLPDGSYVFKDLPAGTYTVTEQIAQPVVNGATTLNGTTTAGTVGGATSGTATPVATVPSAVAGIVLPAGKASVENDFGEILPVSIGGTVFFDANDDGVQSGAAETGIAGVDVVLSGTDDTGAAVSVTVKTDANGHYSFEGLRPGIYTVTEPTQPAGTANGKTVAGSAGGTATPVTTVPSAISTIDLRVPGTNSTGNNFAEVPTNASITGKVWLDRDNDGVIDTEETGLPGVTVKLTGTDLAGNPVTRETTTGPDGSYAFDELPPGTYVVTEPTQPTGTGNGKTVPGSAGGTATPVTTVPSAISGIVLGVGQHATGNDFGELPLGSIAGKVYSDNNDNGSVDAGEAGIGGVQVVLSGTDDLGHAVNVTVTTDADGNYRFDGLRPGTYAVTEPTQPPHTLNGITTPGSIDGVQTGSATQKTTTPSAISNIVLPIGGASVDNDFGEIGDSPDLVVSKNATPVKFTVNNAARYTISVRNAGQQPTTGEYLVQDRLPDGVVLAGVPTGAGWTCTGAAGESSFGCRSSAVIAAGATSPSTIAVPVTVGVAAAGHGAVDNAVLVSGGGENDARAPTADERAAFAGNVPALPVCDPAITQNACRLPAEVQLSAAVSGTVWQDVGSDRIINGGDPRLPGWTVELVDPATGAVVRTTTTNADGTYRFADVVPGERWRIRFRDPASGTIWAWPVNGETASGAVAPCDADKAIASGGNSSCRVEDGGISQLEVVLKAGEELPQQSLPVDPSGVVYDAVTRQPVAGAVVTLTPVGTCAGFDPASSLYNTTAGGYAVNGNAVSMTTGANGFYEFWFSASAPARCEFQITVTPPGGYTFASTMIPAETQPLSPSGSAGSAYPVQPNATAPTGPVGNDTRYYLSFFTGSGTSGIVHNHIPLDAAVATGLTITKTGDRQVVEVGDTLQYTITVRQTAGAALSTVDVVDRLPHGFTYIAGTARANGRAIAEPLGQPGPRLSFDVGPITVGGQIALTYRVRVGVGSQQGDGINRAQAFGCSIAGGCVDAVQLQPLPGALSSNQAQYRVRVTGGVFTNEGCVLGKIFVDCNNNHVQDPEEIGIPGVRLYFEDGTWVISDSEGKYSYCGLQPQSHTLKVDASTLPVGSRLTTSSNRNLGDADSLFIDLKNGELHRADFVEGSCSNPVIEQVKARRTQGEVRAPETEAGQPALRFESKPLRAPQQATDSANQRPIVDPRPTTSGANKESQP